MQESVIIGITMSRKDRLGVPNEEELKQQFGNKFLNEYLTPVYRFIQNNRALKLGDVVDPLLSDFQRREKTRGLFGRSHVWFAIQNRIIKLGRKSSSSILKVENSTGLTLSDYRSIMGEVVLLEDEHARAEEGKDFRYGENYENEIILLRSKLRSLEGIQRGNIKRGKQELEIREDRRNEFLQERGLVNEQHLIDEILGRE